ncbi:MAG: hypothetical protein HQ518_06495 [Rhodopirellula sp.]|nr:hypothetical protein [Rhodopirellula sp.]
MTIRVLRTSVLAVLGFGLLGSAVQANDADGIARVSHTVSHPQYQNPPQGQYYVANAYGHRPRQEPNPTYWTWMPLPFHGCCNYCADANCPGKKGFWTFPAVRWVLDPDYYAVSPDYGWSPPARVPVRRQNVTYQNYGPNTWGGNGAASQTAQRSQIIATPTDTTQLGYYYQHVPTWQPKNILPVPPHPQHWHTRPCQPDQNMSYVRWVRLQNAWVPLHNLPGNQMETPTPAQPAMPQQAIPAPPVEGPPVPVIPMRPMNEPEALNTPEISEPIKRVSS